MIKKAKEKFSYKTILMSGDFPPEIEKIAGELKISKKVTTYTARHSYSTILKRSGASIEFISEQLGHKDTKTTQAYLDSFEDDTKREFAKKLTDF